MAEDVLAKLRDDLDCPLCLRLLFEPLSTPCGHTFCRSCLKRSLEATTRVCPTCRAPCLSEALQAPVNVTLQKVVSMVFPAEYAQRIEEARQDEATVLSQRLGLFFLLEQFRIWTQTPIKLVVYEPRYLLLMQRCMETNAPFGICDGPMSTHGIMVRIQSVNRLPHGRLMVDAIAGSRFRLAAAPGSAPQEEPNTHGLHYATIEPYDDQELSSTEVVSEDIYGPSLHLLSPASAAALRGLPTDAAARMLRDALAAAITSVVGQLSPSAAETLRAGYPPMPSAGAPPRSWSLYASAVLALSAQARQAAFQSTCTFNRLLLTYSFLEKAELKTIAPPSSAAADTGDASASAASGASGASAASTAPAASAAVVPGLTPLVHLTPSVLAAFGPRSGGNPFQASSLREAFAALMRTGAGRSLVTLFVVVFLLFVFKLEPDRVYVHRTFVPGMQ
jgi:hypothetical protein